MGIMHFAQFLWKLCTNHESWNIVWLSYQCTKYLVISRGPKQKDIVGGAHKSAPPGLADNHQQDDHQHGRS